MVKAYAGILACPVTAVQNSSFEEQRRPSSWKMVPVPKLKPVIDINKYLRRISLTSVISKLAHPSVLYWLQAIDGSEAAVRVVPFDYRKAFDLSDHTLLVHKVLGLSFLRTVALWVADFLTHRQQRVKLSRDCFYEWDPVPAGV